MHTQRIVPIERLEGVLRKWEQMLLIVQATFTYGAATENPDVKENLKGAVLNWSKFRQKLLQRIPLDPEEFTTPEYVIEKHFMNSPVFNILPFLLHKWSATSRRIYTLSEHLQRSLEMTSLGKLVPADIHPPFKTFAIQLPIQINWSIKEEKGIIDFVVADFEDGGITLFAFGPDPYESTYLPHHKRVRLMRAIQEKDYSFIRTMISGLQGSYFNLPPTNVMSLPARDEPIADILGGDDFRSLFVTDGTRYKRDCDRLPEYWHLISRMIFGLCLHMEHHSHKFDDSELLVSPWKAHAPRSKPLHDQYITDEALVCGVNLSQRLSAEEIQVHNMIRTHGLHASGYHVSAHFRRSHWRRAPRSEADSPKCVRVRSATVNTHRLPHNGVPVGQNLVIA